MQATPKTLYQNQPPVPNAGNPTAVYTAPAGGAMITTMAMCNTTANQAKFRLHIVPSGGAASAANAFYYDFPVSGNDTPVLETAIPLAAGATLQVSQTTANAITLTICGPEVS